MIQARIGVWDSGLGGLSVWKEIIALIPKESVLYIADQAYCPYGGMPANQIIERAESISEFLVGQGCEIIVIACNTATAASVRKLRERYEIPIVGMEPAIKPAAEATKTGKVGVLATAGTFSGQLYKETREKYASEVEVHMQVGHQLVELVESGKIESEMAKSLLKEYLLPMREAGVDQLVLGCTHYPFLRGLMEGIVEDEIAIIDPAPAVARQVKRVLGENRDESAKPYGFCSGGSVVALQEFVLPMLPEGREGIFWKWG